MDINQGINYLFSRNGQQFGPFEGSHLVQMARTGQVLVGDYIWSEGFSDWVPAGYFNQLAPLFGLSPGTGAPRPAASSGPVVETAVDTTGSVHVKRIGVSGPGIRKANLQSDAPQTRGNQIHHAIKPGASFGMVVFAFLSWIFGIVAMTGIKLFSGVGIENVEAQISDATTNRSEIWIDKPYILYSAWALFFIGLIFTVVISLKYLYRAWSYIQDLPGVTTTPGRAVRFLFIPFFNLVWLFFAYYRWSSDYNMRCDLSDPIHSKRVHEGLFMTHCILTILTLGIFTYLPVMHQMCRAINQLAISPELDIDPNAGYSL